MSIQIVKKNEASRCFELSTAELEVILSKPDVKDREIVVISIAGAFRKGKSFILNFFLKYLNEKFKRKSIGIEWLDDDDECLEGFEWKLGSRAVTSGIHIWNEIFTHDFEDGRKVAIILLDTQGTFDSRTSMKDCTTIFALSTLLSSVQIYNVMQNIQEDDLQHLQLFSEFGRIAAGNNQRQPFNKLLFLVRDWNYLQEHEYGLAGGQEFLEDRLSTPDDQENELSLLRKHLKSCFEEMQCFLMPYPGRRATSDNTFTGQLREIEKDFKNNLKILIPHLLSPEKLDVKKINGFPLKASEFLDYFKGYFEVLTAEDMPRAMPIFEATAEVYNSKAVHESQNYYASAMQNLNSNRFRTSDSDLREQHARAYREATQRFEERHLLGTEELISRFKRMLDEWITAKFLEFEQQNRGKMSLSRLFFMMLLIASRFIMSNPAITSAENVSGAISLAKYIFNFIRTRRGG